MQYFATKQKINPLSREIDCLKELTSYNCAGKETFLCFLKEEDCEYLEDLADTQDKLRMNVEAGFDGCIASGDGTHVVLLNFPLWAANNHKGHKLHIPAQVYSVVANHSHQVLGITDGNPCTWNEKSVALYDELIHSVQDGDILSDFQFTFYEYDKDENIFERKYKE